VNKRRTELREKFVLRALEETGYVARSNGTSFYGERVGYTGTGLPWDGAFIDVIAREVGMSLPSHVYTASALAEFVRNRRLYNKPQRGDIVFFAFSADPGEAFNGPHVGIVIDTAAWQSRGMIQTVEAQSNSGLPKGSQLNDGVYKRVRHSTDVIGFGRPGFESSAAETFNGDGKPFVAAARVKSGKPNRDVENVQLALSALVGARDMNRGVWCPATKAAFARYQRMIGLVGPSANGHADDQVLARLGRESNLFQVNV
jgi:hypothetical protein